MRRLGKVLALALCCAILMQGFAVAGGDKGSSRKWRATYNSALSLREAAIPKTYKVGSKVRVCLKQRCLTVKAHPGSCTCFDLSDEAFVYLGGSHAISQGVITVTATRL